MAGRGKAVSPIEVIDDPEQEMPDFEIDDDTDYTETPGGITRLDDGPSWEGEPALMSTSSNFYSDPNVAPETDPAKLAQIDPETVDEIQEIETVIVEAAPKTRTVRTNCDVGPIFYGRDEVEMKKGVLYRVPEHIFQYLRVRGLIYSVA